MTDDLLDRAKAAWFVARSAGEAVDDGGQPLNRTHWAAVKGCATLVPELHDRLLGLLSLEEAVRKAVEADAPLPPSILRALP